jgi:hypothetical protein
LLSSSGQIGSLEEALSDQLIGWCCIERFNSQPLPDK